MMCIAAPTAAASVVAGAQSKCRLCGHALEMPAPGTAFKDAKKAPAPSTEQVSFTPGPFGYAFETSSSSSSSTPAPAIESGGGGDFGGGGSSGDY